MRSSIGFRMLAAMAAWPILMSSLGLARGSPAEEEQAEPALSAPTPPAATPAPAPVQPRTLTLEERADIYMARKQYAEAVDCYRQALQQRGPSAAMLWNKLGIAQQHLQNYRAARQAYKKAIDSRKDYAESWNNLGASYLLENRASKSVKFFRQAIKLDPANATFHMNLAGALYQRKRFAEAVDEFRMALSLDPAVLTGHSRTGSVLQTRQADARFFFYMAKAFASLGRVEEAVRYLRRALEEGFDNRTLVDQDPDLKKISHHPAFIDLLSNPPKPIKD